jgi:fibronectin type 3 domain-containing protein
MLDSTSNNNDGTSAGTMLTEDQVLGEINGSLDFDGGDDYIEITDNDTLTPSTALSVFEWINADVFVAGSNGLIFKYDSPASQRSWSMGTNDDQLQITLSSTANPFNGIQRRTTPTLSTERWYFVGFVFNGTNTSLDLYIDGVAVATTDVTGSVPSSLANNTRPVFIGYDDLSNYFNGLIDETRIYNTALHAMDILTDYNMSVDNTTFLSFGAEETESSSATSAAQIYRRTTRPTISNAEAIDITDKSAVIIWKTDNDSHSEVRYGKTLNPSEIKIDWKFVKDHSVELTNLEKNTTYYYQVKSKAPTSNTTQTDETLSFTTNSEADTIVPTTPQYLRSRSPSSDIIDLSWKESTDDGSSIKYNIERNNELIATTKNNSFRDTNLTPLTTYTYRVTAIDPSGNKSPSASAEQRTARNISTQRQENRDVTPPSTPENLTAVVKSDSRIDLSWDKSKDEDNFVIYKVFRGNDFIARRIDNEYRDVDLPSNTTYSYSIEAFDTSLNKSSRTFPVTATTFPKVNYCSVLQKQSKASNSNLLASVARFGGSDGALGQKLCKTTFSIFSLFGR